MRTTDESEQCNSNGKCSAASLLKQDEKKRRSTATKGSSKAGGTIGTYDKGDMRGIANSVDPYNALLEMGVIKSASEFFNRGDR
jgi:hypothetical protein